MRLSFLPLSCVRFIGDLRFRRGRVACAFNYVAGEREIESFRANGGRIFFGHEWVFEFFRIELEICG